MCGNSNCWTQLVGMQNGTAAVGNSMEIPQKIKNRMPYDPEISLLVIYPEELKAEFQRDICTSMFITAFSTRAKR